MKEENIFLQTVKSKITAGDIAGAERKLHKILTTQEFTKFYGNSELPSLWGYVTSISIRKSFKGQPVPTALVDLVKGSVVVNPDFLLNRVESLQDMLFLLMHERDHRILRRVYRIDWGRLNKILDCDAQWIAKIRNVVEDAWINASIRTEMGISSTIPEKFYCWSQEDALNPGAPSEENPKGSGFDPSTHKVGEPKSEEYAILTCLSPFVQKDLSCNHEGLYVEANKLTNLFGLKNNFSRGSNPVLWAQRRRLYDSMLSFPEWFDIFCEWLERHKDEFDNASAGSEHDDDCPKNPSNQNNEEGKEGDGEGSGTCAENEECTCNGGEGLFSRPMSLKERLSRIPDIVKSMDSLEEKIEKDGYPDGLGKDPYGEDQDIEIFTQDGAVYGSSWGGRVSRNEVVPKEIQDLSELEKGLLEIGGSSLTDAWATNTVQIKGAVKKFADELVQNIATMRVTEHKINRPDFNMPMRPSRRDMVRMGMGDIPVMWETPQYLEQNELVVYTDVSGSMNMWYSLALYITNQLKEFGCELYQFSTVVVKPVPGKDDNVFIGTGGTHFPVVANHIVTKGFKAVVVITDNEDSLNNHEKKEDYDKNKWINAMKELDELYVLFLARGKRPNELDIKKYPFGGLYGNRGWQLCTDNITAIFESDID